MQPASTPVSMAMYPTLATVLLTSGVATTGAFFLYEVTKTRHTRSIAQEAFLAAIASVLLGLGCLFLLLWTGVYV